MLRLWFVVSILTLAALILTACSAAESSTTETPNPEGSQSIAGEILIDPSTPAFSDAAGYVYLEDVGRLDAPASIIDEQVIEGISHQAGEETVIPFSLTAPLPEPQENVNIRAHIDLDGDRQISSGDLITIESYPIDRSETAEVVRVRVRGVD
jgi:uncharacterized lipoprotein YbaY